MKEQRNSSMQSWFHLANDIIYFFFNLHTIIFHAFCQSGQGRTINLYPLKRSNHTTNLMSTSVQKNTTFELKYSYSFPLFTLSKSTSKSTPSVSRILFTSLASSSLISFANIRPSSSSSSSLCPRPNMTQLAFPALGVESVGLRGIMWKWTCGTNWAARAPVVKESY